MLRATVLLALFVLPAIGRASFSIDDIEVSAPTKSQNNHAEIAVASASAPAAFPIGAGPEVVVGAASALANDGVVERATTVPAESWTVSPADATLRNVLAKWAAQAGWQLVWEASVDVPVTVSASFNNGFRSAVKQLFSSLSAAEVNLTGLMYTGNRVLRVTETGRRAL